MGKTRRFFSKFIKPKLPFFIHKSKSSATYSFRIPLEVQEEVEEVKEIPTSNFPTFISKETCFKTAETIQEVQEEEEEDGSASSVLSEFFSCTSSVSDEFYSCSSFHELSNVIEANNNMTCNSSVSEYFSCTSLEEVGSQQQQQEVDIVDGDHEVSISQRFLLLPSSSKSVMENKEMLMAAGVCSEDPYWDFRSSMEAMVEAHKLRDHWPHLLELLSCYMKLNEKRNHRIILIAFMDLILQLTAQDS